jgi:hypothetical protein
MALFLLCPNLGWIQGQFNFTELSLRYPRTNPKTNTVAAMAIPDIGIQDLFFILLSFKLISRKDMPSRLLSLPL